MKIAYVSIFDAHDVNNWSGTPLHMWQALEAQGNEIEIIDTLHHGPSLKRKLRKLWGRYVENRDFLHFWDVDTARGYAADVRSRLENTGADVVLSPSPIPLAFVNCPQPKILWTDASFAALTTTHSEFSSKRLCTATVSDARHIDHAVGSNCQLLLFASEWGAGCAIRDTAVNPNKVAIIPYGANCEIKHGIEEVRHLAANRPLNKVNLLFVGVNWRGKGAAKAIRVTQGLRDRGLDARLSMVGCYPPAGECVPHFVDLLGFISKTTQAGRSQLNDLYRRSHFLIVPTIADAFGLVFAEASAFGVPSLSHRIGGVSTVVRNDVNGYLFEPDEPVAAWVDWATCILQTPGRYCQMAESSFREYETRLNWNVAGREAGARVRNIVEAHSRKLSIRSPELAVK